ncbi:MAG: hypothetical protein RL334_983 [Chloroflexota bacterium]|jgi:regulatory protein|nr:MAG: RecX family transcriptional regulator [Chloroflexota bacterium]
MPTVTALQPQAGNQARVNVHLDGEFALGLSGGRAAEWHVGQVLTEAQVELVRTAEAVDSGVKAVRRLLDVRPRTDGEMRARLLRKGFAAAEVEQIMQRVEQAGEVNDARFATQWVETQTTFRPRGARALVSELRRRGLDAETIAVATAGVDELAAARMAAAGRMRRLAALPAAAVRRKLGDFLQRRGFAYDVVRSVVTECLTEQGAPPDDLQSED